MKDNSLFTYIIQGFFVLLLVILPLFSLVGCGTVQYVPVETINRVEYRDTTIFLTDTITVEVPREIVREVLPQLDTSVLKTSVAESVAYLDTAKRKIHHTLEQNGEIKVLYDTVVKYSYIDRYIEKEKPIEVVKEVKHIPNWCWYSLVFNILIILSIAFKIYLKFMT